MMTIYQMMFALFLKHWVCDFLIQSDAQIKGKAIYGNLNGISHSIYHAVFTMLILFDSQLIDVKYVWMLGLFEFMIHYHIDYLKCFFNDFCQLEIKDKEFWWLLGFDQFLHYMTYLGIIYFVFEITK